MNITNRKAATNMTQLRRSFLCLLMIQFWLSFQVSAANHSQGEKFTSPPGEEPIESKRLIDQATEALRSGKSTTDILTDPTYLSAHEWPRFRELIRLAAKPVPLKIVTPQEPGELLVVTGKVVDSQGQPHKQALVYVYQTSSKGWYSDRAAHYSGNQGDRKYARLFGYVRTDAEGRFELQTIKPGGYPGSDLPSHIHVEVQRLGQESGGVVTEIQFDDDPRLTAAWKNRSQQEGFVIAKVKMNSDGGKRVQVELIIR